MSFLKKQKKLTLLLEKIPYNEIQGDVEIQINDICSDSRKIKKGDIYVALSGTKNDGHTFIEEAIRKGALVIIYENKTHTSFSKNICWIYVEDTKKTWALLCRNYFCHPDKHIKIIGVTGTNGKTSITTLLHDMFSQIGIKAGLISTIENRNHRDIISTNLTTPDAKTIYSLLYKMVEKGCTHCLIEVSSHALKQERVYGLSFLCAVFTNITQDHLDYHKSFQDYLYCKKKLFDYLPPQSIAIVNADDKNHKIMVQNSKAQVFSYGILSSCDFSAKILSSTMEGTEFQINNLQPIWVSLVGQFNISNLLAVYAVTHLLFASLSTIKILSAMSLLKPIRGRFEIIPFHQNKKVIIDYAHTPDALKNILHTAIELKRNNKNISEIICVFGCGGERDALKRPIMGQIAYHNADKVIITNDNPRNEPENQIIDDILSKIVEENIFQEQKKDHIKIIPDRKQAIEEACKKSKKNALILIVGKGHETYQIVSGKKYDLDDKKTIIDLLHDE